MKQAGSILVIDDNPDILTAARLLLKKHYTLVKTCESPEQIPTIIREHNIDLVMLDMNFSQDAISGQEGFYWLKQILQISPSTAVIMMTAYADIPLAVDAIKAGASDFIAKPWDNQQLLAVIAAAFAHGSSKKQVVQLSRKKQGLTHAINARQVPFLGQSPAMQEVFSTIEKAAHTDANILILGESGTGKELAARAIHQLSLRANEAFISVDMGAISDTLFESEFFGHKKGAFTDAKSDRAGHFELASGGSLFMDELGNLPQPQQAKLLAAIQNRQVTPVGSTHNIDIDIRLICATNDNLHQAVADGRFRQDLLYRINTVEIQLPPLRDRKEDIPLLVEFYLNHFANKYKRQLTINNSDMKRLVRYSWPGNVRELAHSIERAVILADSHVLDMGIILGANNSVTPQVDIQADSFDLEKVEEHTISLALTHFQGNVSQAAKALGLTRGALYRRLEKYGL